MKAHPALSPMENTIATLVLYNKTMDKSITFKSLVASMEQMGGYMDILIYDNSPLSLHQPKLSPKKPNLFYIHDPSNPGISKAYNTGLRVARQLGKKWLMLLDDDTYFPLDALKRYSSAMSANKGMALFAPMLFCGTKLYSPCGYISHTGFHLNHLHPGVNSIRRKSLLNSGMCISVDAFEKVGGFNERIPLDFADHDFIRRFKGHFDAFVVVDVTCRHGFSDKEPADRNKSLERFSYYLRGAKNSAAGLFDVCSLLPTIFVRTLRLSVRFRSLEFFRLFLHTFSHKRFS